MNQLHIRLYFRCFMFQNWEVHNIHIFLFFELYTMFWFKSPERETSVVVTSATGELKPLAHAPPPPPFSRSACSYCRRARGAREAALPREATRCSSSAQNRTARHGTAQHGSWADSEQRSAASGKTTGLLAVCRSAVIWILVLKWNGISRHQKRVRTAAALRWAVPSGAWLLSLAVQLVISLKDIVNISCYERESFFIWSVFFLLVFPLISVLYQH